MTITYRASTTITISPQNVASSSNLVNGVESDVYDNTTNQDDDVLIGGTWTAGTTPTINTNVLIFIAAIRDDAPTYHGPLDGTASAENMAGVGSYEAYLKLGGVVTIDVNTSNRVYDVGPFSVAELFAGNMPNKFVVWITHNTAVNSNSTAGNHVWKATGVKYS